MAQPPYGGPPPGPPFGGPPGYGPVGPPGPQGGGYGENPYLSQSAKSGSGRGCAIAAIVGVVVLVLVLVAGGIGLYFFLRPEPVEYTAMPECSFAEGAALNNLVPEHERTLDEFTENGYWDELQCDWSTPASSGSAPGYVYLRIIRNDSRTGTSGAEEAESDLRRETEGFSTTPVSNIGEEAYSFYDTTNEVGCVDARIENMYIRTCYDATVDLYSTQPVSEAEAVSGAETLSRALVGKVEAHSY